MYREYKKKTKIIKLISNFEATVFTSVFTFCLRPKKSNIIQKVHIYKNVKFPRIKNIFVCFLLIYSYM